MNAPIGGYPALQTGEADRGKETRLDERIHISQDHTPFARRSLFSLSLFERRSMFSVIIGENVAGQPGNPTGGDPRP